MPGEIAGVGVVILIVALVQVLKGMGMAAKWAPAAAIALGVLVFAGNQLAQVVPAFQGWYNVIMWGIAVGLMASGLYSGGKTVAGG